MWLADEDGFPRVIAHQGGNQEAPAHTHLAFSAAAEAGVDIFELDVVLTADDQLAVIHDLTVDRTTDGSGLVSELTYASIRLLDAGYGLEDADRQVIRNPEGNPFIGTGLYVPTLEELFQTYPAMPMLIEIKNRGGLGRRAAEKLWQLIQQYDRQNSVVVASFVQESLNHFREVSQGQVTTSAAVDETMRYYILHLLFLQGLNRGIDFSVFNLPLSWALGPVTVDLAAHRLRKSVQQQGVALHYWTINDEQEMRKLIAMGVDGIITDRPSKLIAIIDEMRE